MNGKYTAEGYSVSYIIPVQGKDWNEHLQIVKENPEIKRGGHYLVANLGQIISDKTAADAQRREHRPRHGAGCGGHGVRYAGAVGGAEPCCTGYRAGQWDEDIYQVPVGPVLYSGGRNCTASRSVRVRIISFKIPRPGTVPYRKRTVVKSLLIAPPPPIESKVPLHHRVASQFFQAAPAF